MTEEQAGKPNPQRQDAMAAEARSEQQAQAANAAPTAAGWERDPDGTTDGPEGAVAAGDEGPAGQENADNARLAELEAQCSALRDQYLRAVAETENVRRRGQEEVAKAQKFAIEAFAEALLPVRDSLELALKTETPSVESMREGVEATLRLFASVFEKNRLQEIDPAGQKFDPNLHQAIAMVPGSSVNPPVPANHVVTVLQKGYLINERVLRPALVAVAEG
jgi:molecular chaperone GrpE